jgi:TonB family protein
MRPASVRRARALVLLFTVLHFAAFAAPPAGAVDPDLYGAAVLRTGFRPEYPADARKAKVGGDVKLRLIVGPDGKVSSVRIVEAADPRLSVAAEKAVKMWSFDAAIEKGLPVASCLDCTLQFDPAEPRRGASAPLLGEEFPQTSETTPARPKATPPGHYPTVLTDRLVPGTARFTCGVSPEGHAVAPRVRAVSHVDFIQPTTEALAEWEFTPAMQGDLPVATELQGEMTFDAPTATPADVLAANGITAPDGAVPALAPEIRFMADPVWPVEALLRGQAGSAEVSFTVTEGGDVTDVKIEAASAPEFGQALAAAVETWAFAPSFDGGRAVAVHLRKRAEFKLPAGDEPEARLATALRDGAIGNAKGLDAKLAPVFQMAPQYPAALKRGDKPAGQALIEFVIDRDGRARLPRVISAAREEFGWAAATAAAQWVFQPPRRGGQPVDVKVRVPFQFAAPDS